MPARMLPAMSPELLLLLGMLVGGAVAITSPPGCTYASGVFTCDYRSCLPLDASAFFPMPQRLIIEEASGTFSNTDFLNFANVNQSLFDVNFPAELTIYCVTGGGGLMVLDATSFEGMDWYKEVRIVNCEYTAIPASAFANLGTVNHFSFEGGNLDSIDPDALQGLDVIKDTSVPTPKGSFSLIDVDLVPGGLPTGFLSHLTNVEEIILSNSRLFTIALDTFTGNTNVKKIVMDHNPFTYLPDNVFSNNPGLGVVSMAGVSWECTCNNLWFLDHFQDHDVLFTSAISCTLPSSHYGSTAYKYYQDVCDSGPDCDEGTIPSVNVGGVCLTVLQIVIYVFAMCSFGFGVTALFFACQAKSELKAKNGGGPPGGKGGAGKKPGAPNRGDKNRVNQRPRK